MYMPEQGDSGLCVYTISVERVVLRLVSELYHTNLEYTVLDVC